MTYDAVVIGAGPAGYPCAIRLAQLGKKVAVVENREIGGVCLNVGCIPSKAMIAAAKLVKHARNAEDMGIRFGEPEIDVPKLVAWKEKIVKQLTGGVGTLLGKNGIDVVHGTARVVAADKVEVHSNDGVQVLEAANIVVATGSRPIELPGFAFDGKDVWSSTEALAPEALPDRLLVIGGGVIGLELGFVYHNLGTEVRVVEFLDHVLPGLDAELSKEMLRSLKKRKIPVHLQARAKGFERTSDGLAVTVEIDGKDQVFHCDKILSAVGRAPNGKGLGLEELGVEVTDKGFVPVDAQRRTGVPSIFAIGDLTGQPMLAHKGTHEGLVAAAVIAGDAGASFDPVSVPGVVFTDPEVATVGLTEEQARAQGFEVLVGKFPYRASGRALSLGEPEGWAKVLVDKATDKLLGFHLIGPEVTELIAEGTLALELGATAGDLSMTIHAHPTLSEALMEAAEHAHKMAVHILN